MATVVQLLGPPLLVRDSVVYAAARGRKVWALLAYLTLSEQPPSRQQLVDPDTVGSGNTVRLRLPQGAVIDVHILQEGSSGAAVELQGLGRELLEGVNIDASPGFNAWLLGERRRLQALGGAVLREGALRALASGNAQRAVQLATRLVGTDPLSEDAHILLVRGFAATGDEIAVERQLAASMDLFRRELGVELAPELYEAARMEPDLPAPAPARSRASVQAAPGTRRGSGRRRRGRGRHRRVEARRDGRPGDERRRPRGIRAAGARIGARARDERTG